MEHSSMSTGWLQAAKRRKQVVKIQSASLALVFAVFSLNVSSVHLLSVLVFLKRNNKKTKTATTAAENS